MANVRNSAGCRDVVKCYSMLGNVEERRCFDMDGNVIDSPLPGF